jgi:hypothetical protein
LVDATSRQVAGVIVEPVVPHSRCSVPELADVVLKRLSVPPGPSSCPYSPECVEEKFSEVARRGVYSVYSGSKQEESAACRVFSMG